MVLTANIIRSSSTLGIDATTITSGTLPVTRGGTGVTTSTGTGNLVLSDGPTLSSAVIGGHTLGRGGNVATATNVALGASSLANSTTGSQNTAVGYNAMLSNTTASQNTAIGFNAMFSNTTGAFNAALGRSAMYLNTTGSQNTALGLNAMFSNTTGNLNTAIGASALNLNTTGNQNTTVGQSAMYSNTTGCQNTAIGGGTMALNTTGNFNAALGMQAMYSNTTGTYNTAVGAFAMQLNATGSQNTALGYNAMFSNTTGNFNTALGMQAMASNTTGSSNTTVGMQAMYSNTTGTYNTAVGQGAMISNTTGSQNTAIGYNAIPLTNFTNCSAVGANTAVTASNQIQLGDLNTTTYVYGTVQNRSDARDKADVRDTTLGLDFINQLRPVDYKWNLREEYVTLKYKLESLECDPIDSAFEVFVSETKVGTYDPESSSIIMEESLDVFDSADVQFISDVPVTPQWKSVEIENENDGIKKRTRYHHGFIAQELQNLSFGGYQDHSIKGGKDVLTLGYDEFIAPLVKAVQELHAEVTDLKLRLSIE